MIDRDKQLLGAFEINSYNFFIFFKTTNEFQFSQQLFPININMTYRIKISD